MLRAIREAFEFVKELLWNKWLWIIVGALCSILLAVFLFAFAVIALPNYVSIPLVIMVLTGFVVAGANKDMHQDKTRKRKRESEEAEKEAAKTRRI
ncbi:MAG TPA: hypothetical protein VK487_05720 [Candidatus Bathyarchaeia archaeon]|nr:hypothetical protein [Candidatus Bathyarchaeia archaeon]